MFGKVTLSRTVPVYSESPFLTIRRTRQKALEEPATEPAEKNSIPIGRRAVSRAKTMSRRKIERTKHATLTYATGEENIEKLEVDEVRTVSAATNNRLHESWFESGRLASPRVLNSSNTRLYESSNDVRKIDKLLLD